MPLTVRGMVGSLLDITNIGVVRVVPRCLHCMALMHRGRGALRAFEMQVGGETLRRRFDRRRSRIRRTVHARCRSISSKRLGVEMRYCH